MSYYQDNHKDLERFVDQNVYYNVTMLVTELIKQDYDNWWHLVSRLGEDGEEGREYEVFSYYIVSDYFAELLEKKGEVIEQDFHGVTIWGRTTYGQHISMDGVVIEIYKDLYGE